MSSLLIWLKKQQVVLLIILGTFVLVLPFYGQQVQSDSITTSFRKGRWLTGLSGSISSGSATLDTVSNRTFTNQYSFDFSTGKFFKNRWLLGGIFKMQRDNSRRFVELESEILLAAPLLSYYLSDNELGSIFFSIAPGYTRFREKTVVVLTGTPTQEELKGGGFGLLMQLGYSYVMHDRIVFDLGIGLNSIWVNANRELESGQSKDKVSIRSGNLLFSFGFNVLLDEFFF
ncbi:MAG: hypothetical protein DHS20C17_24010 [Cyclobacteriaceae bacterium]|nr:MAG: hypothetical protein DHS20C17_24010 [Cyclobacteriaceae bacterium]